MPSGLLLLAAAAACLILEAHGLEKAARAIRRNSPRVVLRGLLSARRSAHSHRSVVRAHRSAGRGEQVPHARSRLAQQRQRRVRGVQSHQCALRLLAQRRRRAEVARHFHQRATCVLRELATGRAGQLCQNAQELKEGWVSGRERRVRHGRQKLRAQRAGQREPALRGGSTSAASGLRSADRTVPASESSVCIAVAAREHAKV
jgi:hypothetical protein